MFMIRRKVLNNFKTAKRLNGTKQGSVGRILNILDRNGERLAIGNTIRYGKYSGVLLYNYYSKQYGVAIDYSMCYGENKYDINSYSKFIDIPLDNGARMEIEKLLSE